MSFEHEGFKIRVELRLRAEDASKVKLKFPEHSKYWFDNIDYMFDSIEYTNEDFVV